MSMILKICLKAAREFVANPTAVRKADFPSRGDFDDAIAKLADAMEIPGERFYQSYARALESSDGQLLWAARERAAIPEPAVYKGDTEPLSKAEQGLATLVKAYIADHPGCSSERALLKVLETRAGEKLYQEYEKERAGTLHRIVNP